MNPSEANAASAEAMWGEARKSWERQKLHIEPMELDDAAIADFAAAFASSQTASLREENERLRAELEALKQKGS